MNILRAVYSNLNSHWGTLFIHSWPALAVGGVPRAADRVGGTTGRVGGALPDRALRPRLLDQSGRLHVHAAAHRVMGHGGGGAGGDGREYGQRRSPHKPTVAVGKPTVEEG